MTYNMLMIFVETKLFTDRILDAMSESMRDCRIIFRNIQMPGCLEGQKKLMKQIAEGYKHE